MDLGTDKIISGELSNYTRLVYSGLQEEEEEIDIPWIGFMKDHRYDFYCYGQIEIFVFSKKVRYVLSTNAQIHLQKDGQRETVCVGHLFRS